MRTRLKWPISGMAGSIFGLTSGAFLWAGIVGIVVEVSMAIMILVSLLSEREFVYDSWVGWLLIQYIATWDVSIVDIINLICSRIFCFCLLLFPAVTATPWLILPVALYLLGTCIHVLPDDAPIIK